MNQYAWRCYRRWEPNYSCNMVSCYDGFSTYESCDEYCRPPEVDGFDLMGMTMSCKSGYMSEPRATSPEQCAYYCNKDLNNCQYFMWDSSKAKQDPAYISDSNCILFNELPNGCLPVSYDYPSTQSSLLYRKKY